MTMTELLTELWRNHDAAVAAAKDEESETMKDYFIAKASGIQECIAAINYHFNND